jgi:hypothetical protein
MNKNPGCFRLSMRIDIFYGMGEMGIEEMVGIKAGVFQEAMKIRAFISSISPISPSPMKGAQKTSSESA